MFSLFVVEMSAGASVSPSFTNVTEVCALNVSVESAPLDFVTVSQISMRPSCVFAPLVFVVRKRFPPAFSAPFSEPTLRKASSPAVSKKPAPLVMLKSPPAPMRRLFGSMSQVPFAPFFAPTLTAPRICTFAEDVSTKPPFPPNAPPCAEAAPVNCSASSAHKIILPPGPRWSASALIVTPGSTSTFCAFGTFAFAPW